MISYPIVFLSDVGLSEYRIFMDFVRISLLIVSQVLSYAVMTVWVQEFRIWWRNQKSEKLVKHRLTNSVLWAFGPFSVTL